MKPFYVISFLILIKDKYTKFRNVIVIYLQI